MDSAKGYHTAKFGRVLLWNYIILANHTERGLIAVPDGIDLMAAQCTMKIQLTIVIHITDGYGVWIAIVTQQSQRTRCGTLQDANRLCVRKLLANASHWSKFTHFYPTILSPTIDAIRVKMKNMRQNVPGSSKKKMPISTEPTAPTPVQTG